MIMAKPIPPPRAIVVLDERWLAEWFKFGFKEMGIYLAKQAAFDAYCDTHPRPKEAA